MTLLWIVHDFQFKHIISLHFKLFAWGTTNKKKFFNKKKFTIFIKVIVWLKTEWNRLLTFDKISICKTFSNYKNTSWNVIFQFVVFNEVRSSRVNKLRYKVELYKMASHFELLTQTFLYKFFFRVTDSLNFVNY